VRAVVRELRMGSASEMGMRMRSGTAG